MAALLQHSRGQGRQALIPRLFLRHSWRTRLMSVRRSAELDRPSSAAYGMARQPAQKAGICAGITHESTADYVEMCNRING